MYKYLHPAYTHIYIYIYIYTYIYIYIYTYIYIHTGAAADAYARHKESHLNTAALCASQGVAFVPMVAETTGLWETGAARVLRHIAAAAAARSGDSADIAYSTLLQELSVVIRSFRARAALRRRSEAAAE